MVGNKLEQILINDVLFYFDREREFIKDGHAYCRSCGERIDKEPIEILGVKRIFKGSCSCVREEEKRRKLREKEEKISKLKDRCFLSKLQRSYTFENYRGKDNQSYRVSVNYVKHFENMLEDNVGLLFYGSVGSGKTYLACSIANAVIEKYLLNVKVKNFSQIINEIQNIGFDGDKNLYIDKLVSADLLVLDDLGMERNTSYAKEQIYSVIDSRYLKNKPTIFTTNLSYENMADEQDIDYKRIYSRILGMAIPVLVDERDYRDEIRMMKLRKNKGKLLESL